MARSPQSHLTGSRLFLLLRLGLRLLAPGGFHGGTGGFGGAVFKVRVLGYIYMYIFCLFIHIYIYTHICRLGFICFYLLGVGSRVWALNFLVGV